MHTLILLYFICLFGMKIRFRKKYIFLLLFFLAVLYLFWGPLFPWSPVKIGFTKIECSYAAVYIEDYDGDSIVYSMDEIIREEESFHGLKFKEKFKVIILGKDSNMKRYLPWMGGTGYSVKLGSVNVIYIGPNGRNSPYGIGAYIKHEMSHLLIHQNTPAGDMEIRDQAWLAEGIATYYGGPHYFEKKEFVMMWKENGFAFDSLYEENPLEMDKSIIRLKYTYYRFFVEFLVNTFGLEKFQAYLHSYINDPENYKSIFSEIYGIDLPGILRQFGVYMLQ